jgi:uncharacterized oxidoreductase
VLITGRNAERLGAAREQLKGVDIFASDISDPEARERLAAHIRQTLPGLNIVINNAGIQRRVSLAADDAPWSERQTEIDTLLSGPVHLNHLLLPILLAHERPGLIANVTSGGAYIPQPFAPIYSACKAALHSYTVNLRHALAHTRCRVVEIIPPAVKTALAGPAANHGAPLDDFSDAIFLALSAGDADEIGYGMTDTAMFNEAKIVYRSLFETLSTRFPITVYSEDGGRDEE